MGDKRFDEIELQRIPDPLVEESAADPGGDVPMAPTVDVEPSVSEPASRMRRMLAFLTSLSLFVALGLALSPLLPYIPDAGTALDGRAGPQLAALGGFLLLFSFFYSFGTWLIWGKGVGGAIFGVRVVRADGSHIDASGAARRWLGTAIGILTAGLGFLPALLASRRSIADLVSGTRCVRDD